MLPLKDGVCLALYQASEHLPHKVTYLWPVTSHVFPSSHGPAACSQGQTPFHFKLYTFSEHLLWASHWALSQASGIISANYNHLSFPSQFLEAPPVLFFHLVFSLNWPPSLFQ